MSLATTHVSWQARPSNYLLGNDPNEHYACWLESKLMFNIILMRPTTPLTNHDYCMAIGSQDLLPKLFQPWKKSHPDPVYI